MKHHIQRMVIELGLENERQTHEFQNKISRLFKNKLQELTDKILSEYSHEATVIQIDSIDIDLGILRKEHIEEDFLVQYEFKFRQALSALIPKFSILSSSVQSQGVTTDLFQNQQLKYLLFFFENGRFPNNAPPDINLNDLISSVFLQSKKEAVKALISLMQQKQVGHRLAYTFAIPTLYAVLNDLLPQQFQTIRLAINNVLSVYQVSEGTVTAQKIQRKLFLIIFELINKSTSQNGLPISINLDDLNRTFLEILPKIHTKHKQNTPIYSNTYVTQTVEIDIKNLHKQQYNIVKSILQTASNRYYLIEKATKKDLRSVVQVLSGVQCGAIFSLIDRKTKSIEKNTLLFQTIYRNIWSAVIDYLSKKKSKNQVDFQVIQKIVEESWKSVEQIVFISNENTTKTEENELKKSAEKEKVAAENIIKTEESELKKSIEKEKYAAEDIEKTEESDLKKSVEKEKSPAEDIVKTEESELKKSIEKEKVAAENIVKTEESELKKSAEKEKVAAENIVKTEEGELKKSAEKEKVAAENIVKTEENELKKSVEKEKVAAENIVKTEESELKKSIEKEKVAAENIVKTEENELKKSVEKEKSAAENIVKTEENELKKSVEKEKSAAENIVKTEESELKKSVEKEKSAAENIVKTEESELKKSVEKEKVITKNVEKKQKNIFQIYHYRMEDIVETYLMQGYLIQNIEDISQLLTDFLNTNPQKFRLLLYKIGKYEIARNRLISVLPDVLLESAATILIKKEDRLFIQKLIENIGSEQGKVVYKISILKQLEHGTVYQSDLLSTMFSRLEMEDLVYFAQVFLDKKDKKTIQPFERNIISFLQLNEVFSFYETSEMKDELEEGTNILAVQVFDYLQQYFLNEKINTVWWLKNISEKVVNEHFKPLIERQPNEVMTLLEEAFLKENTPHLLVNLLKENNLTVLMNVAEPAFFGFISTVILLLKSIFSTQKAWEIVLTAYQKERKPFEVNAFLEEIIFLVSKQKNENYEKTLETLIKVSAEAVETGQPRFTFLKHLFVQKQNSNSFISKVNNELKKQEKNDFVTRINTEIEEKDKVEPLDNIVILAYYFKYGTLPNEAAYLSIDDIQQRIKEQGLEDNILLKVAIHKALTLDSCIQNWQVLPKNVIQQFAQSLQPKLGMVLFPYFEDLQAVVEEKILVKSLMQTLSEIAIFTHEASIIQTFITFVVQNISKNISITEEETLEKIIKMLEEVPQKTAIIKRIKQQQIRFKNKTTKDVEIEHKPEIVVPFKPLKDQHIYIDNAGVVILASFLPHLFRMFDLTDSKKFKDIRSAYKAAYMIQYIAKGDPNPLEHQLVLNKILCGIPLEQPFNDIITLTTEEQQGCEQLVKAVIQRWEKMKNASVEGLRNTFLKREGKLLQHSKGWTLTVEQKPYDLLLKTLPWGISLVRFKWMEKPLFVEFG